MRDYQISLYDESEAIQRDMTRALGVSPDGKVFDAENAHILGLITNSEKDEAKRLYQEG